MRAGVTQVSPTASPDIRFTIGSDVYTSQDNGRLTRAYLDEQVWGGQYVVELDNSDESLNSKDYKGSTATIHLSFIGSSGSNMSPLWVHNQQFISREGKLLLQLNCIDAWGLLSQVNADLAMAAYNQNWQQQSILEKKRLPSGEEIPQDLIDAIIANYDRVIFSILEDLFGTIGKSVTLDDDDGIINARKPGVRISNPTSGARVLLGMTKCYAKWKTNGTFGTVQPTAHSVVYSYNAANLFFNNLEDAAVVIPNRVTFYSLNEAGDDWINGTPAVDSDSYAKLGVYIDKHYLLANLEIDARATEATLTALAEGALAKIQGERSQGMMVAPMHCSQELFDKIEIVDSRYDTPRTTTGYVHRIIREYDRGVYRITVQLGGVTSGYTPPGGNPPIPEEGEAVAPPSVPGIPLEFLPAYLPAVIDIDFTAVDDDDVEWDAGTIKTADGSVWNINSGSKNLANSDVYYAYYDVGTDDGDIDWTQTFGNTISHERILIGFFKKASSSSDKALIVIGSQGPDLFIDVLSAITANLGLINAGEIRIGTGTLGVDFTGWRMWLEGGIGRIAGYQSDNLQFYTGSDGKLYAGGGAVKLDSDGVTALGDTAKIFFKSSDGIDEYGALLGFDFMGIKCVAIRAGDAVSYDGNVYLIGDNAVFQIEEAVRPYSDNQTNLGTSTNQWKGGYYKSRLKIPVGTDMYD